MGPSTSTVKAGGQLGFKGPEHLRAVRDGLVPIADVLNDPADRRRTDPRRRGHPVPRRLRRRAAASMHKHIRPGVRAAWLQKQQPDRSSTWCRGRPQYLHLKVKADALDALDGHEGPRARIEAAQDMCQRHRHGAPAAGHPWGETIRRCRPAPFPGVLTSAVSGVDGKFWEFLKYIHPDQPRRGILPDGQRSTWTPGTSSPANHKAIRRGWLRKTLEPEFWATSVKADTDSLAAA